MEVERSGGLGQAEELLAVSQKAESLTSHSDKGLLSSAGPAAGNKETQTLTGRQWS